MRSCFLVYKRLIVCGIFYCYCFILPAIGQQISFQNIYVIDNSANALPRFINGNQGFYLSANRALMLTDSIGNLQWLKNIRVDSTNRNIIDINNLKDNKFIGSGTSFIAKFNQSFSNLTWVRSFSVPYTYFTSVLECSNSDIVSFSQTFQNFGVPDGVLAVRTDSIGDLKWSKVYNTQFGFQFLNHQQAISTDDNGIAFTGNYWTNSSSINTKIGIVKLDSLGVISFAKAISTPGLFSSYIANSIKPTSDNGFILSGKRNSHGFLLKLDSLANIDWMKYYEFGFVDGLTWAEQTADGGYIVTGNVTGSPTGPMGQSGIIAKTDSTGTIIWARQLGGDGVWTGCVRPTSDNGYMISCRRPGGTGPNGVLQSYSFIKTDSLGYTGGCLNWDIFPIVSNLNDTVENILMWDSVANVSFNPATHQKWNIAGTQFNMCSPTGLEDYSVEEMSIEVSPNPNSGSFRINLSTFYKGNTIIEIHDLLGNVVYSKALINPASEQTITLPSELTAGMYFCRILSGSNVVSKRFVLNR